LTWRFCSKNSGRRHSAIDSDGGGKHQKADGQILPMELYQADMILMM